MARDAPSFDKWVKLPNGEGVLSSTALPFAKLRKDILERGAGLFWLEAPPASGKSSLGHILSRCDKFTYITKQLVAEPVTEGRLPAVEGGRVFIDEAQMLDLREIGTLRGFASSGGVVVCAGISGAPSPTCPRCSLPSCRVCISCLKYECGKEERGGQPCCGRPDMQETISMVVADSAERRHSIDSLRADEMELTRFLQLFLDGCQEPIAIVDDEKVTIAAEMGRALLDWTGGAMGLITNILRHIFLVQKPFKTRALTADTFRGYLLSRDTFDAVKSCRMTVTLSTIAYDGLVQFLRQGVIPSEEVLIILRKKALLRRGADGYIEAWSPLVCELLCYKLFETEDHPECSFSGHEQMITFAVKQLETKFRSWVLDRDDRLKHEDEINAAIAWVLKSRLGRGAHHAGPAKHTHEGTYMQVDHAIWWATEKPWLLEVCLTQPASHCARFGDAGSYKHYDFGRGIVLWISTATSPTTKLDVPDNCSAYHVHVPAFTINRWSGEVWESLVA